MKNNSMIFSSTNASSKEPLAEKPLRVALFEPRIPPNTGNIARTCAAFGLPLDLIEPLGFSLEDRYLKRAGLDYWPHVDLSIHKDIDAFFASLPKFSRVIGCSRRAGGASSRYGISAGRCFAVRSGGHRSLRGNTQPLQPNHHHFDAL